MCQLGAMCSGAGMHIWRWPGSVFLEKWNSACVTAAEDMELIYTNTGYYDDKEVKKVAVKIRLRRMGKKKAPFYRVVVADARAPRDGRFIEEIGTYDPNQDPSVFKFDEEKAKKWLANGAKPTETVGKLLKEAGIAK